MYDDKLVVWLHGEIKTPPFSAEARIEAGCLLRRLQHGESLGLPHARPVPVIGARCHELRVKDKNAEWRIICRLDADAVIVAEVFGKKARTMPEAVIANCQRRLRVYDAVTGG